MAAKGYRMRAAQQAKQEMAAQKQDAARAAQQMSQAEAGSKAAVRRLKAVRAKVQNTINRLEGHGDSVTKQRAEAMDGLNDNLQAVYAEMRDRVGLYRCKRS
jgi:hypothetical protein